MSKIPEVSERRLTRIRDLVERHGSLEDQNRYSLIERAARDWIMGDINVSRPASVQAAFDIFEGRPDTGPHATALFDYVLQLEAALRHKDTSQ